MTMEEPEIAVEEKYKYYLYVILLSSFLLKWYYAFYFTDYKSYLFSDFGGYFQRAEERLSGNIHSINQFAVWPPAYHYLLTEIFRILKIAGLYEYRLTAIIIINIALSTACVYFIYEISNQVTRSSRVAVITAAAYAFSFPFIYLNAFVMSEHPAFFLCIFAVYLTLKHMDLATVSISGLLMATAVAIRPALGLYGLSFFTYYLVGTPLNKNTIIRSFLFSGVFFAALGLVVLYNNYISEGRLTNLSANGGLNFAISQCQMHRIGAKHDGYYYVIIPPSTVQYPENGAVETHHPFYDFPYYFKMGRKCIQERDNYWTENLAGLKNLFFGVLLPSVSSAKFFSELMPPFRWMNVSVALLALFSLLIIPAKREKSASVLFIASFPLLSIVTGYFFYVEHRFFYGFAFSLYVLAGYTLSELVKNWSILHKKAFVYASLILFCYGAIMYYKKNLPTPIHAVISYNNGQINDISQTRDTINTHTMALDAINFKHGDTLDHETYGDLGKYKNVFIDFSTIAEVLKGGELSFEVYADDGFAFYVDDKLEFTHPGVNSFKLTKKTISLQTGRHNIKISYFQKYHDMGIKVIYRNGRDKKFYYLGQDSQYIKFHQTPEKQLM